MEPQNKWKRLIAKLDSAIKEVIKDLKKRVK